MRPALRTTLEILEHAYDFYTLGFDCPECTPVGVLIAHFLDLEYAIEEESGDTRWIKEGVVVPAYFSRCIEQDYVGDEDDPNKLGDTYVRIDTAQYRGRAKEQLEATGYSLEELFYIQAAWFKHITTLEPDIALASGMQKIYEAIHDIHKYDMKELNREEVVNALSEDSVEDTKTLLIYHGNLHTRMN